ncbi:MAG TPA: glucuronate isomerase [Polyangia bacterium]|nr:glucuronate isomerase [Polyangia bacterium]
MTKAMFLDEDFLLDTPTAVDLYHGVAAQQPIIDYHCHLSPHQIADDHRFRSITEIWLEGDHYKWRAMRADGVPERLITGDASDWEKFAAWAGTVPRTLRNPLYHWTHLELRFPFGVRGKRLDAGSAREIFEHCNRRLGEDGFTTQGLLRQFDVRVVCSTDDPIDDLEPHRRHARKSGATTRLFPTWRPDKALALNDLPGWNAWLDALGAAANMTVATLDELREALRRRHDAFHEAGCRASDHGLERMYAADYTEREVAAAFAGARAGKAPAADDVEKLRSALLHDLALLDHRRGWVQQFHLGALRDTSTRGLRSLGPNTGYDAVGDFPQAVALARFLDRLDATDQLAKTIVYNLNPADNEAFATVIGSFQDGSEPGKMQLGSAWWFLDQLDGMRKQIDALSNMGLLSRFVGMLTDSRSFLSFSRHEYFRRLLCGMLGQDVARGLVPDDRALLAELVEDVCFRNARRYFGFRI